MNSTRLAVRLAVPLVLFASVPLHAQEAKPRVAPGAIVRKVGAGADMPHAYSVVIVLGDMQTASSGDTVPPAARKALTDMKDFLPYKGYRLLDAQWILGSQRSIMRLRGPEEQDYQLTLRTVQDADKIRVFFQLQEPGGRDLIADSAEAQARQQEVRAMRERLQALEAAAARERGQGRAGGAEPRSNPAALTQEAERLKRQIAAIDEATPLFRGRPVIDTNFSMDVGETVVVGTSRVRGGDKALIALLTAVPRGNGTKKE